MHEIFSDYRAYVTLENFRFIVLPLLAMTLSIGLSFLVFDYTRKNNARKKNERISDRIYELDRLIIQNPELQRRMYEHRQFKGEYFTDARKFNDEYFQLKTFVYYQLNFFDELINDVTSDGLLSGTIEFDDWKTYVVHKMRHPLVRELFGKECGIFGERLRLFVAENRTAIEVPLQASDDCF